MKEISEKQALIENDIQNVTGRLNEDVSSIDDVITMLDYIESLKMQDNKVEEISNHINDLKTKMIYSDKLELIYSDGHYKRYLEMRNWPRTFTKWIETKKQQLLSAKENLFKEMSKETDMVFNKIRSFADTI